MVTESRSDEANRRIRKSNEVMLVEKQRTRDAPVADILLNDPEDQPSIIDAAPALRIIWKQFVRRIGAQR